MRWTVTAGLLIAFSAAAQTPADKCRLEGTVLNRVNGQPVRKARLALTPVHGEQDVVTSSDSHGKYSFDNLTPGTYTLTASHDGYMGQRYGAKKFGEQQKGETLELAAGAVKSPVDLRMTPLGTIMGFVRDEEGEPIRQVDVAVLAYRYGPSGRKLQEISNVQTDALGEYRLFDLPPGNYYLRARPQPPAAEMDEAYTTVFYPNAPQQSSAAAIDLAAGQELRGMDFVLRPVAVSFIRGHVIQPSGGGMCLANLQAGGDEFQGGMAVRVGAISVGTIMSVSRSDDGVALSGKSVDKDMKFEFRNIPLGSHTVVANCAVGKERYATAVTVVLDAAGIDNLELRPVGPSTISGKLRLEGESKNKLTETQIWLGQRDDTDNLTITGTISREANENRLAEDGTFMFRNVSPDVYSVVVGAADDVYVKSITEDGRDVRESGLDLRAGGMSVALQVVLSANGGRIDGTVDNGAGAKVTLIPADLLAAISSTKEVTADEGGHFEFDAVAPGRYKVFAWEDPDVDAMMYDAEVRKPYESKGQTVEVAERQQATVKLQLISRLEK